MKKLVVIAAAVMFTVCGFAQESRWFTKTGQISFFSKTTAEDIDAKNNEVFSLIDGSKAEVAFQVLVTGFKFKKSLMEEHFNENYMESTKFPKAVFKGSITDPGLVNFKTDGEYKVDVSGDLTLHGVTKKIVIPAIIRVKAGNVSASSTFPVKLADYGIRVPGLVAKQISEAVDVSVACNYEPYK
jgi:YceI-like domain